MSEEERHKEGVLPHDIYFEIAKDSLIRIAEAIKLDNNDEKE